MDPERLIERYPRLFHVTEAGAWASIRRRGLLSTTALLDLFEVRDPLRSEIETRPRPDDVVLEHPAAGRVVIRDNRPLRLHILERCLDCSVADWCRLLNGRAFFWATEKRLENHLRARGHRGRARQVVVVDTARLVDRDLDALSLCRFNSGSTLYPNAPRRGPETFVAVSECRFDDVAEVCVRRTMEDVEAVAESVVAIAPDGARTTIWRRC